VIPFCTLKFSYHSVGRCAWSSTVESRNRSTSPIFYLQPITEAEQSTKPEWVPLTPKLVGSIRSHVTTGDLNALGWYANYGTNYITYITPLRSHVHLLRSAARIALHSGTRVYYSRQVLERTFAHGRIYSTVAHSFSNSVAHTCVIATRATNRVRMHTYVCMYVCCSTRVPSSGITHA
jgi:hypothetical protein